MIKEMSLKTTKFPYFFWSFNKNYSCVLDLKNNIYQNKEKNTQYSIKKMNPYCFLFLKYLPVCAVFFLCFNIDDFIFKKFILIAYGFALLLFLAVNLFERIMRNFLVILLLIFSFIIGDHLENLFLSAYVLKYFLFFTCILMFYLDCFFVPYCLLDVNNKVVANILIPKKEIKNEN